MKQFPRMLLVANLLLVISHVHAGDHVWIVLEGEGVFLSEGQEKRPISPGTILSAPAGISHGVENTGRAGLIFASISAG